MHMRITKASEEEIQNMYMPHCVVKKFGSVQISQTDSSYSHKLMLRLVLQNPTPPKAESIKITSNTYVVIALGC